MYDPNFIRENIAKLITSYLAKKKQNTLLGLARRTNISYATIRRLAHGESDTTPETAFKVINEILETKERRDYLQTNFSELFSFFSKVIETDSSTSSTANQFNPEQVKLILLVYLKIIKSITDVQEYFGKLGLVILNELITRKKIQVSTQGLLKSGLDQDELKLLKKELNSHSDIYANFLSEVNSHKEPPIKQTIFTTVTPKVADELHKILTQAFAKLEKICDNPESHGQVPFYYSATELILQRLKKS